MDTCNNCGGYTTSDPYLANMLDGYPCECNSEELEEYATMKSDRRERGRKTPMVVDGAGIKTVELNRHYKRPRKGRKEVNNDTQ